MIKVLIVDDSATVRDFLAHVLGSDVEIRVIGAAGDGMAALEFIQRERPDIVTMDIDMPRMDGFEATRRIMETTPVPVVIVSGLSLEEQRATFRAFEAGALAVVPRPHGPAHPDFDASVRELINTLKAMAEVKVVRRWPKVREPQGKVAVAIPAEEHPMKIIGVGASTGGPAVLRAILSGLPPDFSFPIVLVQHMTRGFLEGFANWLASASGRSVELGVDGVQTRAGRVYVAPQDTQMGVNGEGRIVLAPRDDTRGNEHCPSISFLLRSLADSYGPSAVGVLLTGMGRDGADAMRVLKDRGAITIVQSAETCIVKGMPEAALQLDAATCVLSPHGISALLAQLASKPK